MGSSEQLSYHCENTMIQSLLTPYRYLRHPQHEGMMNRPSVAPTREHSAAQTFTLMLNNMPRLALGL